jgi:hypothetical protein
MHSFIAFGVIMLLTAEACLDKWDDAYTFFAKTETSTDIYVIESVGIFEHRYNIYKSLKNNGVFVFKKNPSTECEWMDNLNYNWKHDNKVMYKGNTSDEMDLIAYKAASTSMIDERAEFVIIVLAVIIIATIGFAIIYMIGMCIKDAITKWLNCRYEPVKVVDPQTPMVDYTSINPIGLV